MSIFSWTSETDVCLVGTLLYAGVIGWKLRKAAKTIPRLQRLGLIPGKGSKWINQQLPAVSEERESIPSPGTLRLAGDTSDVLCNPHDWDFTGQQNTLLYGCTTNLATMSRTLGLPGVYWWVLDFIFNLWAFLTSYDLVDIWYECFTWI